MPDTQPEAARIEVTEHLFVIEKAPSYGYFAVRDSTPMFCLAGETIGDAVAKAEAALNSYRAMEMQRRGEIT